MPTIQGIPGAYRLFFYSFDCSEPPHVQVQRERKTCRFWLQPLTLSQNHGFPAHELNGIRKLIQANQPRIEEAWHEHWRDG